MWHIDLCRGRKSTTNAKAEIAALCVKYIKGSAIKKESNTLTTAVLQMSTRKLANKQVMNH